MAPAISTPVGPPPTTTKVSSRAPLGRVGLGLGLLEGEQDAPAQIGRVVDRLQAGRERRPVVVTEIGVPRAGRDDQIVVGNAPAFGDHLVARGVDRRTPPPASP